MRGEPLCLHPIGFIFCVSRMTHSRPALSTLLSSLIQESLQPSRPGLLTTLQDQVERVEERVDGGVDRQHEDGHGHVDLTGDRNTARRQRSQQTDGKPAQEVRGCHGGESAGDHQIFRRLTAAVKVPVCGERHQRSQGQSLITKHAAFCRSSLEVNGKWVPMARSKAMQLMVKSDTSQDRKGRKSAILHGTLIFLSFLFFVTEITLLVHSVRYADDSQVDLHDEVGHVDDHVTAHVYSQAVASWITQCLDT